MTAIRHDHRPGFTRGKASPRILLVMADDLRVQRLVNARRDEVATSPEMIRTHDLGQALSDAEQHRPDLVVVDLSDHETDEGLDELQAMTELLDCPVVAIVAEGGPHPFDVLALGADECVVRVRQLPVTEIDAAVGRALARSHARPSAAIRSRLAACPAHGVIACRECETFGEFARVLAHDLRAPVRTARLHVDYLVSSLPDLDEDLRRFSERLDGSLGHLEDMVASILDYATLTMLDVPLVPIPLAATIREAVEDEAADLRAVRGSVLVDVDDDLEIVTLPGQFGRVILNLLANAIVHGDPEDDLVVTIRAIPGEGTVRLLVSDNGRGVDPTDAERVFQPLFRRRSPRDGGLGLGLPMCRRIVENSGGSIRVLPTEEAGATIEVVLRTP